MSQRNRKSFLSWISRPTMTPEGIQRDRLIVGGTIAFCVVIVQALIALPNLERDTIALTALFAFAIAIPLLSSYILICHVLQVTQRAPAPLRAFSLLLIGLIAAGLGMDLTFLRVSVWLGVVFLICGLVGVGVWISFPWPDN